MAWLALAFFTVSVAELVVLVLVEGRIGLLNTLLLILLTGVVGAYLVTRQGLGVARAVRDDFRRGVFPGRQLAHGAMILVGGAFLFTPGLITDTTGLLLMTPPVRDVLWRWGARYFRRRLRVQ